MKKRMLIAVVLFISAIVIAGGFQISVESGSTREKAIIIKTFGCHTPSDAEITGTAEGIVDGKRRSIKLNFNHDKKGVFTAAKQWSDEGAWIIIIEARYNGMNSNAIVEIDSESNSDFAKGNRVENLKVKIFDKNINPGEISKLLHLLNKS
jgi:hypothetical protein